MKAKYIRVSTIEQNTERQEDKEYKSFIDKCSGAIPFAERLQAGKLIQAIESGLIKYVSVHSIDRLGRNQLDILNTIEWFKSKNVNLKIENLGVELFTIDNKINPAFQIITSVMATIAEMEREQIKERQKEGIAIAKAKGIYTGRKVGSVESIDEVLHKHKDVVKYLNQKMSVRDINKLTSKSTATIQKVKKLMLSE